MATIFWSPWPQNLDARYGQLCHLCQAVCFDEQGRKGHEIFHDTYVMRGKDMSAVAWCDPGNHAFKAGEKGSQNFAGSTVNDEGETVRMQMDACSKHAFQSPGKDASTVPAIS